ncbi:hypothetical protein NK8_53810 (plasmid) [Caballeronia sp. NK8]|uniref:hypothetical protein n=1 Tax=Caballeronia sp. NK8 TaxID=140098 RepID=UPI001BB78B5E|nr:hypothetical protein [Caballeronia sp. NK8]BCQ27192.1 hypothetical protein NK8_53810 [Caballeronia sp. NK8]
MTYQTIETLTLGLVRDAKGIEVSVKLPTGAVYTVRALYGSRFVLHDTSDATSFAFYSAFADVLETLRLKAGR